MNDYRQVNRRRVLEPGAPAQFAVRRQGHLVRGRERLRGEDRRPSSTTSTTRTRCAAPLSITEAPDFDGPAAGCDDPNFETYWEDDIDPADILEDKAERSLRGRQEPRLGGLRRLHLGAQRPAGADGRRALYLRQEGDREPRSVDSGGALGNNFNFEFFTNGTVSDSADWDEFTPRVALVLRPERRRHALRHGLARLQVRRLRDLRLRPERRGHQRRRLGPGRDDTARVRPRAGGQLRDRGQDAAARQHAAGQRLAVPVRLHGPAARLLRPGLLAGRERRRGTRPGPRARPALGAVRALGRHGAAFRSSTPRSPTRPTSSRSAPAATATATACRSPRK